MNDEWGYDKDDESVKVKGVWQHRLVGVVEPAPAHRRPHTLPKDFQGLRPHLVPSQRRSPRRRPCKGRSSDFLKGPSNLWQMEHMIDKSKNQVILSKLSLIMTSHSLTYCSSIDVTSNSEGENTHFGLWPTVRWKLYHDRVLFLLWMVFLRCHTWW